MNQFKKNCVMVVDFGTSGVRAVLIDISNGITVVSASTKYPMITEKHGYSEIDPEVLWNASVRCVEEVIRKAADVVDICCLTFSWFGDNLILLNSAKQTLTRIVLGFDCRGENEAEWIAQQLGDGRFEQITGCKCEGMCTGSKILWFRRNQPEIYTAAAHFWTCQQYVCYRLGIDPINDITMASRKCLMDVGNRTWSSELLNLIGIKEEQLGTIVESDTIVGKINHYGSVSLNKEIPVMAGAHDSDCGIVGTGVYSEKQQTAGEIAGTFDHIGFLSSEACTNTAILPEEHFCSYCGPIQNTWISFGAFPTSGAMLEWFMREMFGCVSQEQFSELWNNVKADATEKVICIPDISSGDAAFMNISFSDTRISMFEAMIESLTFEARRVLESCMSRRKDSITRVRIGGGASRSDKWAQLRANVFGCSVERMETTEVSALGAAMIAATALGFHSSIEHAAEQMVRTEKVFEPEEKTMQKYQKKYNEYLLVKEINNSKNN